MIRIKLSPELNHINWWKIELWLKLLLIPGLTKSELKRPYVSKGREEVEEEESIDIRSIKQLRKLLLRHKQTIIEVLNKLRIPSQEKIPKNVSEKDFINEVMIYINNVLGENISLDVENKYTEEIILQTKRIVDKLFSDRISDRVKKRYTYRWKFINIFEYKWDEDIPTVINVIENDDDWIIWANELLVETETEEIMSDEVYPNLEFKDKPESFNELWILKDKVIIWKISIRLYKAILNLVESANKKLDLVMLFELINTTNIEKLLYIINNSNPNNFIEIINNSKIELLDNIINNLESEKLVSLINKSNPLLLLIIFYKADIKTLSLLISYVNIDKFILLLDNTQADKLVLIINTTKTNNLTRLINEWNIINLSQLINNCKPGNLQNLLNNQSSEKIIYLISYCYPFEFSDIINTTKPDIIWILIENSSAEDLSELIKKSDPSNFIYLVNTVEPIKFSYLIKNANRTALSEIINTVDAKKMSSIMNLAEPPELSKLINNIDLERIIYLFKRHTAKKIAKHIETLREKWRLPWYII